MKKSLLILSLFSLFFISIGALSDEITNDTENFKGLNLGLGLSVLKYKSTYNDSWGLSANSDQVNYHSTNVVPRFDGSYLFALNDKWLFGAGLSFDLSPFNGENYDTGEPTTKTKIRTKNHFSLYLQPTYAIDSSLAVFGKLSYQSSSINAIWTCPVAVGCYSDHMRLDGVGLGLGLKKMINKNIYVQLEGEYVDYDNKTLYDNANPFWYRNNNSYSGTLSAGYHF